MPDPFATVGSGGGDPFAPGSGGGDPFAAQLDRMGETSRACRLPPPRPAPQWSAPRPGHMQDAPSGAMVPIAPAGGGAAPATAPLPSTGSSTVGLKITKQIGLFRVMTDVKAQPAADAKGGRSLGWNLAPPPDPKTDKTLRESAAQSKLLREFVTRNNLDNKIQRELMLLPPEQVRLVVQEGDIHRDKSGATIFNAEAYLRARIRRIEEVFLSLNLAKLSDEKDEDMSQLVAKCCLSNPKFLQEFHELCDKTFGVAGMPAPTKDPAELPGGFLRSALQVCATGFYRGTVDNTSGPVKGGGWVCAIELGGCGSGNFLSRDTCRECDGRRPQPGDAPPPRDDGAGDKGGKGWDKGAKGGAKAGERERQRTPPRRERTPPRRDREERRDRDKAGKAEKAEKKAEKGEKKAEKGEKAEKKGERDDGGGWQAHQRERDREGGGRRRDREASTPPRQKKKEEKKERDKGKEREEKGARDRDRDREEKGARDRDRDRERRDRGGARDDAAGDRRRRRDGGGGEERLRRRSKEERVTLL